MKITCFSNYISNISIFYVVIYSSLVKDAKIKQEPVDPEMENDKTGNLLPNNIFITNSLKIFMWLAIYGYSLYRR